LLSLILLSVLGGRLVERCYGRGGETGAVSRRSRSIDDWHAIVSFPRRDWSRRGTLLESDHALQTLRLSMVDLARLVQIAAFLMAIAFFAVALSH